MRPLQKAPGGGQMGNERRQLGRRQGRSKAALPGVVFAALLVVSGIGCDARAGEGYALMGVGGGPGGALGGILGGDGADGLHGYAGVIYAPGHLLSDTGLLLRAWAKAFEFSYETDLIGMPDARIRALGYGVHLEAGWQIAGPWGRAALIPGVAWRGHNLTPADPGSRLEKDRIGLTLTADGEWRFSNRYGVMANVSYDSAFRDYWVQMRPFVDLGDGWKVGIDYAGYGGPDYTIVRAGAFTSGYELPINVFGRVFVGAEAGVQRHIDRNRVAPFAGVNVGVLF
jgi:hypothetical protein